MEKIFFFLITFFFATPAVAEIYKWVDEKGKINFTDNIENVPPKFRDKIETKETPKIKSGKTGGDIPYGEYHIPFEKTPAGSMIVEVSFNESVKGKMIFDTGASMVVISKNIWDKLKQQDTGELGKINLVTAGGIVEAPYVMIKKVTIGGASKELVHAAVHTMKEVNDAEGLLGLSFLKDFKITIDHNKNQIVLKKN